MGERDLIQRFRAHAPTHPWVRVGPGQDCAILTWGAGRALAFKIDQVVEGTHFLLGVPQGATPLQVGWKAMAKACSDIAAAGCWPVAATAAVHLRRGLDEAWAEELYEGLCACCQRYRFALAGGDISSGSVEGGTAVVCVSLLGAGPAREDGAVEGGGAWLRSGAQPGDALLVTGELGGSRTGKHLEFQPRLEEARAIRERAGAAVHACIDITDGLSRDAGHLCSESRCGVELEEAALPVSPAARTLARADGQRVLEHVLGDGEDFELLLAVEPGVALELVAAWRHPTPLRRIGTLLPPAAGRRLRRADGSSIPLPDLGWEHLTGAGAGAPGTP